MAGLINLPGYNPGPGINFAPVQNALYQVNQSAQFDRQNALMQRQMGMQEKQLGMQTEKHGLQMAAMKREQEVAEARQVAGRIQYIQGLPPEQQGQEWQRTLQMPGFKDLPPELRDFNRAAPALLSKAAEYYGEKDRAQIGLIQAQAEKARREAANGGELPMNVKEWQHFSRLPPEQQQQYLTMKRAQRYYDTGTEFVSPNAVAPGGPPVATIRKDPAGKAEQTKIGEFAGGAPQREQGKRRLDTLLGGLAQDYLTLDKTGGVVNPDKGTMDNLAARARSSGIGQTISGAMGSKEQSIRQQINNSRPLLIQGIMQATGMSARALDSNKELEFYLQAVTNPQSDLHSNLVAIDAIDRTYGLGGVLKRTLPPEAYNKIARDAELAIARRPIAAPTPQGAAPAQAPAAPQRLRYNPETGDLE